MKRSTWDTVKDFFRHPDAKREPTWMRADNLTNSFLGFGNQRDRLVASHFNFTCRLTDFELYSMYYSDDICAKIVNKRPAEVMRRGYCLRSKTNPDAAKALQEKGRALNLDERFLRGKQWGRLYGGAVLIIGANDSADLTKPLVPERAREVKYLTPIDRRWAVVTQYQNDPTLANYGEPELYTIGGLGGRTYNVHASRVLRFDGVPETDPVTRRALAGWTFSVLQRPYEVVRDFAAEFKAVAHLLVDASQGVWKIQNLLEMLSTNRDLLMTRLAFADMSRSTARSVMLDAENENFERVATSFAGIDAMLDRSMMRLSAAADLPVSILMGRSPAGMNATGESDFRAWYDELGTEQKNEVTPQLIYVYKAIGGAETPADLEVEWYPLWMPSETEKATIYNTTAQADSVYLDRGVVLPEQVAIARFGSGEGKIEIDEEALETSIQRETELLLNPPKQDPNTPADPNAKPATKTNATNAAGASPDAPYAEPTGQ